MTEKIYNVEIKGITPLLQNKFAGGEPDTSTKKKTATTKENAVEDTLYEINGETYHPAEAIRQALIEAGKAFKKGKSNLSKTFASFCMVSPEAIPLKEKWITDRRAVVIPSTKGRVMRNRAKYEKWNLVFQITILDNDEISEKVLHDALEYAGHYIGIGDYRPQKKGMYGRFIVTSIKEAK